MTGATIKLQYALIRLGRGMLTAWEEWLKVQQSALSGGAEGGAVQVNPDPQKFFGQLGKRHEPK